MTGMARCSNRMLDEIVSEINSSRTWWMCVLALLSLSCFISAPESVDSWGNGDWRFSGRHQEAHTTLYSEFRQLHYSNQVMYLSRTWWTCTEFYLQYNYSSDWCDHLEIKLVFVKCPVVNYSLFVALPWHMSSSVHILHQIGPNGYYFAIDPNGYVLLHPNLQPKVWSLVLWITLCSSCLEAWYYFCLCRMVARERQGNRWCRLFSTFSICHNLINLHKKNWFPHWSTVWLDISHPKMSAKRSFTTIWDEKRHVDLAAKWHICLRIKDKKGHYCVE